MTEQDKNLKNFHIPRWEELPNIDLYLDQVVTFLEDSLSNFIKEDSNNGKNMIITKTMINNYVKQGILEPPVKKKYNRKHIAYLFTICILKQVYSISDVNKLITLAIKTTTAESAYNSFCKELENAINLTFQKKIYSEDSSISKEKYILRNVAQTFACKLYVQKVFLK